MARRVKLENLRFLTLLIIQTNQNHRNAKRPHRRLLRIHLIDISKALGKQIGRDGVSVLVLKLSGFRTRALHLRPRIRRSSRHNAADLGRNHENVCHRRSIDQLVR